MKLQVNRSDRDPELLEIRWQTYDKRSALDDFERIDREMLVGHTEELTSHRKRKNKGQRRSCTVHIRHIDTRVGRMTVARALEQFGFLGADPEVLTHS